ncbi:MAG: dephospho-CoA kinase [Clostridia bacterium]|nr:dephospho-CoA kinase [Clostridia bacterium]
MRVFGITGGSGSGKSTVSAMLAEMGVYIIDTDKIARQVVEKGSECLSELCSAFGAEILKPDGSLDRKRLAAIAFADKEKTALLSRITHKYIKAETERLIANSAAELIGIDGAVLIGSGIDLLCETTVSVTADLSTCVKRITERDNLTEEEARTRLSAQPTVDYYIEKTEYHIFNNGDIDELKQQVRELINKLKGV